MAKPIPFDFVLDQLFEKSPKVKPMFGCSAIYLGAKIVLIARKRSDFPMDNGIWVCTSREHHESLRNEFPILRSISLFGPGGSGWQNIPEEAPEFESTVLGICELILRNDPRVGRIPAKKKPRTKARIKASLKAKPRKKFGRKKRPVKS